MEKLILPNDVMLDSVREMLSEGHKVVLMTRGCSMLPFIVGDRDSVELERRGAYCRGDIVLALTEDGRWVLHRILSLSENGFVLKGDGNLSGTERCSRENVAGAVCRIIKPHGEVNCATGSFARRSALWRNMPYIVRRVILGTIRRII